MCKGVIEDVSVLPVRQSLQLAAFDILVQVID